MNAIEQADIHLTEYVTAKTLKAKAELEKEINGQGDGSQENLAYAMHIMNSWIEFLDINNEEPRYIRDTDGTVKKFKRQQK